VQVLAELELGGWFGGGAELYGTGSVQGGLQVRVRLRVAGSCAQLATRLLAECTKPRVCQHARLPVGWLHHTRLVLLSPRPALPCQVVAEEPLEVMHLHISDLVLHGGPEVVRWGAWLTSC
jgi:hypothetical protein